MARRSRLESPILELCITAKPYYNSLYPQFPAGGEMPVDQVLDLAEAAAKAGYSRILLTGTEPLKHPEILDICFDIGRMREFIEFGVSTLGAELRTMATTLKGSGVNVLEIRLDSLQKIKYDFIVGANMGHVLKGISAAERTGFLIRTVTRLIGGANDDEVYDFCSLVKRHCFEQWFIELPKDHDNHVPRDFVLSARGNLVEFDQRDNARRYKVDGDSGLICLAAYEELNRVRVSADMILSAHGEEKDLKDKNMEQLTELLRWAFEPDKRMSFGFEIIEE